MAALPDQGAQTGYSWDAYPQMSCISVRSGVKMEQFRIALGKVLTA